MDKHTKQRVLDIARTVRQDIEYQVPEFEQDLCGWCAIASAELHLKLSMAAIHSRLVMMTGDTGCHVFLNVDGWVVDITATQFREFRKTPVVILHERESEQYDFYEPCYEFDSAAALAQHQDRTGWPHSQIPQWAL